MLLKGPPGSWNSVNSTYFTPSNLLDPIPSQIKDIRIFKTCLRNNFNYSENVFSQHLDGVLISRHGVQQHSDAAPGMDRGTDGPGAPDVVRSVGQAEPAVRVVECDDPPVDPVDLQGFGKGCGSSMPHLTKK